MEEAQVVSFGSNNARKFKRVYVFCGSKAGCKPIYGEAALDLGKAPVERKIDLVYGGGSVGLMGLVSNIVFYGGCRVLGIIPKALMPHEISGAAVGEVKIVTDMHQRKSEMEKHGDALLALPGGYGSMEELLEMITWSQLGIHKKPIGPLNLGGYFNSLLALFDKGVEEDLIEDTARHMVIASDSAEELMKKLKEYAPRHNGVATKQSWERDQLLASTRK